MPSHVARAVTLGLHAGLIGGIVLLAGGGIGLLLLAPLVAPLRGYWLGKPYTFAWASMLLVFYCAGFLAEAYMRPTLAWPLRTVATIAAFEFVSAVLFVRLRAKEARAGASGPPPAARTEA
jgi:uncharacterized membrane protein